MISNKYQNPILIHKMSIKNTKIYFSHKIN
nr:MAG TPA: hypothetical protein [Caudoviricetes sp.]